MSIQIDDIVEITNMEVYNEPGAKGTVREISEDGQDIKLQLEPFSHDVFIKVKLGDIKKVEPEV